MIDLGGETWTALDRAERVVIALPLGSTEQHGPHLPLDTDTVIATALARTLASSRPLVRVAPAIAISASGEHAGFPGTLSLGNEVLVQVLVEIVRSADWSAGVVIVNGHGGNARAVHDAVSTLQREQRPVLAWWPPLPDDARADAHAGWLETSLMLHLDPTRVCIDRAAHGDRRPLADIANTLRTDGVLAVSGNGVLGDPTGADAGTGAELFDAWQRDLLARFDSWVR